MADTKKAVAAIRGMLRDYEALVQVVAVIDDISDLQTAYQAADKAFKEKEEELSRIKNAVAVQTEKLAVMKGKVEEAMVKADKIHADAVTQFGMVESEAMKKADAIVVAAEVAADAREKAANIVVKSKNKELNAVEQQVNEASSRLGVIETKIKELKGL